MVNEVEAVGSRRDRQSSLLPPFPAALRPCRVRRVSFNINCYVQRPHHSSKDLKDVATRPSDMARSAISSALLLANARAKSSRLASSGSPTTRRMPWWTAGSASSAIELSAQAAHRTMMLEVGVRSYPPILSSVHTTELIPRVSWLRRGQHSSRKRPFSNAPCRQALQRLHSGTLPQHPTSPPQYPSTPLGFDVLEVRTQRAQRQQCSTELSRRRGRMMAERWNQ